MKSKIIAGIVAVVGLVVILVCLALFFNSNKLLRLDSDYEGDIGKYASILMRAYGSQPDPVDLYSDETMYQILYVTDETCSYLRFDQRDKFEALIQENKSNLITASAAVLEKCVDQQQKALDWGITDADLHRFPVK